MEALNQQLAQIFQNPILLPILLIWLMFWKGLALWISASKRQLIWFVILFLINTLGILEIAYLIYLKNWDIDKGKTLSFLEKKLKLQSKQIRNK